MGALFHIFSNSLLSQNRCNTGLVILGNTTNIEWSAKIKNNPAPWGELRIPDTLTIAFPSAELRKVDDIERVARFYAKAMQYFLQLMGTVRTQIEERVVFDKEIYHGNSYTLYLLDYKSTQSRCQIEKISQKNRSKLTF